MRILEYPKVQQIDKSHWKLLDELEYKVNNNPNEVIIVPIGFITDFASVPRIFWNIMPPFGEYSSAAVIHDYLYSIHKKDHERSRKRCDEIFLEAMTVLNVSVIKRSVMFRAVRVFGWLGWRKK